MFKKSSASFSSSSTTRISSHFSSVSSIPQAISLTTPLYSVSISTYPLFVLKRATVWPFSTESPMSAKKRMISPLKGDLM